MIYVVDTHALIWFLEGNARLSETAKSALSDPDSQIVIPTIVIAEAAYHHARNHTSVSVQRILDEIASAENCTVYPLDEHIAAQVSGDLELHDSIIVYTAIAYSEVMGQDVALITKDKRITESGLVPVIW